MNDRLRDQDERERELRRYVLKDYGAQIAELKRWVHGRPEDAYSIAVGRGLGEIVPDYLEECAELETEP
jgi:hypothetical protein